MHSTYIHRYLPINYFIVNCVWDMFSFISLHLQLSNTNLCNESVRKWSRSWQKNHPDQELVDFVVQGFTTGFDLGIENGPEPNKPCRNGAKVLKYPEVAQRLVDEEVAKGHILGPFDSPSMAGTVLLSYQPRSEGWLSRFVVFDTWFIGTVERQVSKCRDPRTLFQGELSSYRRSYQHCVASGAGSVLGQNRYLPCFQKSWSFGTVVTLLSVHTQRKNISQRVRSIWKFEQLFFVRESFGSYSVYCDGSDFLFGNFPLFGWLPTPWEITRRYENLHGSVYPYCDQNWSTDCRK